MPPDFAPARSALPLAGTARNLRRVARNVASILRLVGQWSVPVALVLLVLTRGAVVGWVWSVVRWNGGYVLLVVASVVTLLQWERVVQLVRYALVRNRASIEHVLTRRIAREIAVSCTITVHQLHRVLGLTHRTARELRSELLRATFTTIDHDQLSGRSFTGLEPFALEDADNGNRGALSPRVAALPLREREDFVENVLLSVSTKQPSRNAPLPAPADPDAPSAGPYAYTPEFIEEFQFRSAQLSRARLGRRKKDVAKVRASPDVVRVVD